MKRFDLAAVAASVVAIGCGGGAADEGPGRAQAPLREAVADQLLVQYESWTTESDKASARSRAGARRLEQVAVTEGGELELVELPVGVLVADAARSVGASRGVRFAEPNWVYAHQTESNDPSYLDGSLWGLYGAATTPANPFGSDAAAAWAAGKTDCGAVYVGIIDEGLQFTHPDLAANVWTNPFDPPNGVDDDGNGFVDDVHGWDFANGDATVYDGGARGSLDKHGTHVAGTIGGVGGNGRGVVGVCWRVQLISGKFLGRSGGTTANAIRAINYMTDLKKRHGLDVVATNNSWGGGGYSQALLEAIAAGAREGILFVAAAGNGGRDGLGDDNDATKTPSYPSNYDTTGVLGATFDAVIAVAAIRNDGTLATFSNYGAKSVDLGAPGVSILSSLPFDTYGSYSGTSMATPHVTGAAALYAAHTPTATAAEIKAALLSRAAATPSLAGKTVTGGRLDVGALWPVTP